MKVKVKVKGIRDVVQDLDIVIYGLKQTLKMINILHWSLLFSNL